MSKKIAIVGKGASGKDYLKNILINNHGYKFIKPYTTRPMRPNETDDDYYFLSDAPKNKECILYYDTFVINEKTTWEYGLFKKDIDSGDVLVLTPNNLKTIPINIRNQFIIVYVDCDEDIIRERMIKRVSIDNAERRIESDRKDFENFNDFEYTLKGNFTNEDICSLLEFVTKHNNEN